MSRINSYSYDEPERRSSFGTGKKGNNSIIQIYSRHSSRSSLFGQKVEDNRRSVHAPAERGAFRTRRERQTTVAALHHSSADICEGLSLHATYEYCIHVPFRILRELYKLSSPTYLLIWGYCFSRNITLSSVN